MNFIRWLLIPILIIGLRIPTYTTTELFHKYSFRSVLPYILHSARIYGKGYGELVRLLRHKKIPFDWFYGDSCKSLMDPDRFHSLLSLSSGKDRKYLLSLKCIENLNFSISNWELLELGPRHFFGQVSRQAPAIYANDYAFFDLLKAYRHPSGLLQDCSWLISGRVHDRVFREQAHEQIGRGDAWRMFHHSCFFSGQTSNTDFDRMHVLVFWLRDEVTMSQFIEMKPRKQLKWIVHLLIILKRIEIEFEDNAVYMLLPLTEYLGRLENSLSLYNPRRMLIRYCCRSWIRRGPAPKKTNLPDIDEVLKLIRRENGNYEENVRWTLAVLELYHLVAKKDIWVERKYLKMLCDNLLLASAVEQSNWINIYLKTPDRLNFLEEILIEVIRQSSDLQSWVMAKSKRNDPPELKRLIFGGVPFRARLKETRARYFKLPNRSVARLFRIYRALSTVPEHVQLLIPTFDMEHVILSFLSELASYLTLDPVLNQYKIALLSPTRMGAFAFILSTAKLFGIQLGYFDLNKDQERLIFGGEEISWPQVEGRFDFFEQTGRPSHDMLQLSNCKIIRHNQQFPEGVDETANTQNVVIFLEEIMVRISKAVTSSADVFGQLIDYHEIL